MPIFEDIKETVEALVQRIKEDRAHEQKDEDGKLFAEIFEMINYKTITWLYNNQFILILGCMLKRP